MKELNIGGITFNYGRSFYENYRDGIKREWVMTNGLGGYAGTSIIDSPMRKHHGLLIGSLHVPVKRYLILSKLNEQLTIGDKTYPLHTTKYKDRITRGYTYLSKFSYDTFPIYTYQVKDILITKEVILKYGVNSTVIKYTIKGGNKAAILTFNPCFNFRTHGGASAKEDHQYQLTNLENELRLIPRSSESENAVIHYRISEGTLTEASSLFDIDNYYDFEFETGMEGIDTHYTPVTHKVVIDAFEEKSVYIQCEVTTGNQSSDVRSVSLKEYYNDTHDRHIIRMNKLIEGSNANTDITKRLVLSADQFICHRESTGLKTVLAGLPWFSDWGRDTMIALSGLTLVTKQYDTAKEIILSFEKYIKNGLLPNMFPDEDLKPMYNSVDASLWYFQAIYQYYTATFDLSLVMDLYATLKSMVEHFIKGTDFSIYMDDDSLIHAGSGLDQVTWMDVRINGVCVTPRHGKPVEINALWYNALKIMAYFAKLLKVDSSIGQTTYELLSQKVKVSFTSKFWNQETNCLNDVVDDKDTAIRPNQLYAVSLPFTMLSQEKNKAIVQTVYEKLYTTYGIRSLTEEHKDFKPIYTGELIDRDYAYHQGTSWGFLLGPFVTAYRKVHTEKSPEEIYSRFISPAITHLYDGCLGGYAEIFDATPPYHQRGCYSQAWSIGELLRVINELNFY